MRFQKKYKFLNLQSHNKSIDIPTRVLKFRRTKWSSLVSSFKKRKRLQFFVFFKAFIKKRTKAKTVKQFKRLFFFNGNLKKFNAFKPVKRLSFFNSKLQIPLKKWERYYQRYKTALEVKKYYYQLYDLNLLFKPMKKRLFSSRGVTDYVDFLQSVMQFEFRLDIFLWRLRIFKTSYQAGLFINHNFVRVNSKIVRSNYVLNRGDIISFDGKINFFSNLKRLKKTLLLNSFLEIDYYTNSIVLLSSVKEMTPLNFSLFMKTYFDLAKFCYSFK